jgi:glycosyltransferase involved in cell wall biosynthesis
MKLLYLTFYYEPDIGPGAFRNTALVNELARQLEPNSQIHVLTTQPNRYSSFNMVAPEREEYKQDTCSILVERIRIPAHANGWSDQIRSFSTYFRQVHRRTKNEQYDLVVASSSRLFTAFLGAKLARSWQIPLFLDIRDLFREAISDVVGPSPVRVMLNPLLKFVEQYTFGYAHHINLVSEGFRPYFNSFSAASYSYFTNGIDDEFLNIPATSSQLRPSCRTILYAGNIGDGQELHRIIPQAARQLGNTYRFIVIGDGGAKRKLESAIQAAGITNVDLRTPINRNALLTEYQRADYLFVHLSDMAACQRVLPSKLFDYGATDKPILAGVAGYAASFVRQHMPNSMLFNPGDVDALVRQVRETLYRTQVRHEFRKRFGRKAISEALAQQIIQTVRFTNAYTTKKGGF